jgi:hypothetical protein
VARSSEHAAGRTDASKTGTTFFHGVDARRVPSLDLLVMRNFDLDTLAK